MKKFLIILTFLSISGFKILSCLTEDCGDIYACLEVQQEKADKSDEKHTDKSDKKPQVRFSAHKR